MTSKAKQHKLQDSCLYKCKTKEKLYEYLQCEKQDVEFFVKQGDLAYREGIAKKNVDGAIKERPYQKPFYKDGFPFVATRNSRISKLEFIHGRVKGFLQSITVDEYLFSGQKGKSCIDKAKYHAENANQYLVKLDIKKFFPSVTFGHIYKCFAKTMQCSQDVSWILAKLCTYKGILPTSCKMSMHLAYFSHKKCFDNIFEIAKQNDCKYSVWVDDIVISGKKATIVAEKAKLLIKQSGLEYHDGKKCKVYKPYHAKEVTGVILQPDKELAVPHKHMAKMRKLKDLSEISNSDEQKIKGLEQYMKQIKN
jgi:RNA-directed DNA polymerase